MSEDKLSFQTLTKMNCLLYDKYNPQLGEVNRNPIIDVIKPDVL